MWDVSADPVEFEQAIQFFRERLLLTAAEFDALTNASHDVAFTVAGVAQLDVVADVWTALDRAVAAGITVDEFKSAVLDRLLDAWGGTVDNPSARLDTIFRTNVQSAYSRGRYQQATDPDVLAIRPYWMFDAILDGRETEVCRKCDGKVVAANDPWWHGHYPPCHFRCRSSVITLTESQADGMGVTSKPPAIQASTGFGGLPNGQPWQPDPADYPEPLWNIHSARIEE